MNITIHEDAIAEARAARRWYANRDPDVGASFMAALDTGIDVITKAPHIWPVFEAETRRYLIKNFPYSIIYRWQVRAVQVVAIMHSRRRPGYWRDRLG